MARKEQYIIGISKSEAQQLSGGLLGDSGGALRVDPVSAESSKSNTGPYRRSR